MPRKTPIWHLEGEDVRVYVGTYTGGKSKGIYLLELDPASGSLDRARGSPPRRSTRRSWRSTRAGKFLYAVSEVDDFDGKKAGGVAAFAIDPRTGDADAAEPAIVARARPVPPVGRSTQGKNVLVANYGGGSVAVLPIGEDGRLGRGLGVHPAHRARSPTRSARGARTPTRSTSTPPIGSPSRPTSGSTRSSSTSSTPPRGPSPPTIPRPRHGRARLRPAPLRVPSRRPARLRDQRDDLHGDRLRLRPRATGP